MGIGIARFLMGDFFGGLWLGLIGMFLNSAARGSYQQVLIREALQGEPVRHFMNPQPIVVSPSVDLRHGVDDDVCRYHRKAFPVASNGHLEGYVTTRDLSRFPRAEWERRQVAEVMHPNVCAVSIAPDADALTALSKMQHTGLSRLLVTEGDHLVGIVSLKDLLRFLNMRLRLEHEDAGIRPEA